MRMHCNPSTRVNTRGKRNVRSKERNRPFCRGAESFPDGPGRGPGFSRSSWGRRPRLGLRIGRGPVEERARNGPTHPGFAGEPRPDWFSRINDLVIAYLALIDHLNLSDVIVVGNSVGGWIAAEMALRRSPRIVGIVLLNAVGIDTGSPDKKIVDPMAVAPAERAALSFHDPKRFAITPTGPQLAIMAENQRTLRVYAGDLMIDPNLQGRLAQISIPAMVAWGESDRIVDADYGRRWAESIPGRPVRVGSGSRTFPPDRAIGRGAAPRRRLRDPALKLRAHRLEPITPGPEPLNPIRRTKTLPRSSIRMPCESREHGRRSSGFSERLMQQFGMPEGTLGRIARLHHGASHIERRTSNASSGPSRSSTRGRPIAFSRSASVPA